MIVQSFGHYILLNRIQDPEIKRVVPQLANLLKQALAENDALRAENQRLKDEINRLKGEQGKPGCPLSDQAQQARFHKYQRGIYP